MNQTMNFEVPSSHPCYASHFPANPIVPGALLLKWICQAVEPFLPAKITLLNNVKFLSLVRPGDSLKIEFAVNKEKCQLNLTSTCKDIIVLKGSFEYAHV